MNLPVLKAVERMLRRRYRRSKTSVDSSLIVNSSPKRSLILKEKLHMIHLSS